MDGRPLKGRPFHLAPARLGGHRDASEGALDKVEQPLTALLTDGTALLSRPVVTPVASNLSIVAIFRDTLSTQGGRRRTLTLNGRALSLIRTLPRHRLISRVVANARVEPRLRLREGRLPPHQSARLKHRQSRRVCPNARNSRSRTWQPFHMAALSSVEVVGCGRQARDQPRPVLHETDALPSAPEFETSIAGRALSQSVRFICSPRVNLSPAVARGFSLAPPGALSISPAPRKNEGRGGNLCRAAPFVQTS
jgi:hypothetical protein